MFNIAALCYYYYFMLQSIHDVHWNYISLKCTYKNTEQWHIDDTWNNFSKIGQLGIVSRKGWKDFSEMTPNSLDYSNEKGKQL